MEMYHTFWRRLGASIVDAVIITIILHLVVKGTFGDQSFIGHIVSSIAFISYTVLLHGYCGQTIGKRLFNVRVLNVNKGSLGYLRALKRDSVVILLSIISILTFSSSMEFNERMQENVAILESMEYGDDGYNEHLDQMMSDAGALYTQPFMIVSYLSMLWWLSEFITMLFNKKRRAIHDFIAGSVVVMVEALEAQQNRIVNSE